jgi:type I restriction enzyme S subunit
VLFRSHPGDIVVARTGATVGYAKLIREEVSAVFASYLVRFRVDAKRASPQYVGLLVESEAYKSFVRSMVGGAAQPNASAPILGKFAFALPSREEQEEIVRIVEDFNFAIKINRRRIALLEDAARQIYKEWFVRLRFPGYERVKVVNGVPEGWERKRLGELLQLNYGKSLKKSDRVDGEFAVFGSSGTIGNHAEALVEGPGIIVGRKGNVGSVFWSSSPYWPIDTVYYVGPRQTSRYNFRLLQSLSFQSGHGAVPGLNRETAYALEVIEASADVRQAFERTVAPLYEHSECLDKTNHRLQEARDLLLPRLMSGNLKLNGKTRES